MLKSFFFLFLVGSFLGGVWSVARAQQIVRCPKPVVTVGDFQICDLDIEYQMRVDLCYGDTAASRESAAAELVAKALDAETIRRAYGQTPPLAALRSKAEWMKQSTRDSARFRCIRDAFILHKDRFDTSEFYKIIVAPTMINPRLHAYFAVDTSAQSEPIQTISLFWKMVKADANSFDKIKADTVQISKSDSENPLVQKVLGEMKPGEVWKSIIEDDQSYRILKLLAVTDSEYICKILTIEKNPFDPWFREYVEAHIPIVFEDQLLRISLTLKFPQLWWLPK